MAIIGFEKQIRVTISISNLSQVLKSREILNCKFFIDNNENDKILDKKTYLFT